MSCKIRIIGIGNPLMADDGIGPAVIEALLEGGLPDGVEALDGGLGGMSLLPYFEDVAQVILVDAADLGRKSGSVVVAHLDLKTELANVERLSGHGGGIVPLLSMVREVEYPCRVTLIAVQQQTLEPHIGLSEAAQRGVVKAVEQVNQYVGVIPAKAGIQWL